MERLYKQLICLLIVVLLISSCTEMLELEPISEITFSSYWKTEDDANAGLNGMYIRLRDQASGVTSILYLIGEARSNIMSSGMGGTGVEERYYNNTLEPTIEENNWSSLYQVVNDANLVLKYVPNITFTSEAEKNSILAQAYATRAFLYFTMVKTWGDLPLRKEPTEGTDPDLLYLERTSQEEIFTFIKQDIDDALLLFSDNNFPAGRNKWSKPAVNALKADVYLWTGKRMNGGEADFNVALSALNEVETSDIALLDDFASVFDYSNKGNKEIIMALNFKEMESPGNVYLGMYMFPGNTPTDTDDHTKDVIGVEGGFLRWMPTAEVRNQFTNDDQRKEASFIEVYTYDDDGVGTYVATVTIKFNGIVSGGSRIFCDDYIIYRYADILLMKAEAKNALGQDPSSEINKVRLRAYGDNYQDHVFVNGDKELNDEAILKERLLELYAEGKRWWGLVRFDKVFELVPSLKSREGQDYLLLSPISNTTLSLEPKVKQNPGY